MSDLLKAEGVPAQPKARGRRLLTAVVATTAAAAMLAACGSDESASGEGDDLVKINVGVMPLAAVGPVYLGIENGFFEEVGLEVTPKQAQGGAALIPAVLSGDMEFAYGNNVSVLTASSQGLPVRIVANGNDESAEREDAQSTVVSASGSSIETAADLAGKTIAVNTLNNVGDVTIKAALEKEGVDVSDLKFLELGFPDMLPALERGDVDAVWLVTPFTEMAEAAGAQVVLHPFYDTKPGLSIASYFTSEKYAAENPEVVKKFVEGINKSMEYAMAHPEELRAVVKEFTQIPEDVLAVMPLPEFSTPLPTESLELTGELMAKYKITPQAPSLDELLWTE